MTFEEWIETATDKEIKDYLGEIEADYFLSSMENYEQNLL